MAGYCEMTCSLFGGKRASFWADSNWAFDQSNLGLPLRAFDIPIHEIFWRWLQALLFCAFDFS